MKALLALAAVSLATSPALAQPHAVRLFDQLALAPDGAHVASIEHAEPAHDGDEPIDLLVIRATAGGAPVIVGLPCGTLADCKPSDVAFSPDGKRIGFALKQPNDTKRYIFEIGADGSNLTQRLAFDGVLGGLSYGADGRLAFLAIPGAHKEAGAVEAGAAPAGEIGVSADEQRIAVLEADGVHYASPDNLYVYEFDWRPGGAGFVATAAPGNGDNEWWVAKLWTFAEHGEPKMIYAPPPRQQLASPIVSPDGKTVAFIGGIMSDFGSTGGDAFTHSLDGDAAPVNLTPGMKASVTALNWHCGEGLTATALRGDQTEVLALAAPSAEPHALWSGAQTLGAGGWNLSLACAAGATAAIRQTFTQPPEIAVGPIGQWHDLTDVNAGLSPPATATSLNWKSDGADVQGWLLQPSDRAGAGKQPMVTIVHGGPSAAVTQHYLTERSGLWLLRAGYDVLMPNPRGSYGQGEAFTQANVRDFGHGDLRDILAGVDAAIAAAPIDADRLGLWGYSYGGYMAMWTVTQTDRFKAAVAGAGIADWKSYYGQNGIDEWLIPFFGASVYDDPDIYAKSSPIDFIKNVKTPTFIFVGDRDLECPMPQSQEFWHALRAMDVPTEFVVYPGQGHHMRDAKAVADWKQRTLAWYARWLKPKS